MTRAELRAYLSFYADLGVTDLYRADVPTVLLQSEPVVAVPAPVRPMPPPAPEPARAPEMLIPLAPSGDTLEKIQLDIGDCKRCRLCEQRSKIVFGSGDPSARL